MSISRTSFSFSEQDTKAVEHLQAAAFVRTGRHPTKSEIVRESLRRMLNEEVAAITEERING